MNESVGYTVTINIVITFIVIVFVFLADVLIYYKSNKVSNLIVDSIEKYSGFNNLSKNEITQRLDNIGYNKTRISCPNSIQEKKENTCSLVNKIGDEDVDTGLEGYCVYFCQDSRSKYYYYKVKANMVINIPIINDLVHGSVFSSTSNLYDFNDGIEVPEVKRIIEEDTISNMIVGDVNGDGAVNALDQTLIQQYLNGSVALGSQQKAAANIHEDYYNDGEPCIDELDLSAIVEKIGQS